MKSRVYVYVSSIPLPGAPSHLSRYSPSLSLLLSLHQPTQNNHSIHTHRPSTPFITCTRSAKSPHTLLLQTNIHLHAKPHGYPSNSPPTIPLNYENHIPNKTTTKRKKHNACVCSVYRSILPSLPPPVVPPSVSTSPSSSPTAPSSSPSPQRQQRQAARPSERTTPPPQPPSAGWVQPPLSSVFRCVCP